METQISDQYFNQYDQPINPTTVGMFESANSFPHHLDGMSSWRDSTSTMNGAFDQTMESGIWFSGMTAPDHSMPVYSRNSYDSEMSRSSFETFESTEAVISPEDLNLDGTVASSSSMGAVGSQISTGDSMDISPSSSAPHSKNLSQAAAASSKSPVPTSTRVGSHPDALALESPTTHQNNVTPPNSPSSKRASANLNFICLTPNDGQKILTAVAPSGSAKTKARRRREAREHDEKWRRALLRVAVDARWSTVKDLTGA